MGCLLSRCAVPGLVPSTDGDEIDKSKDDDPHNIDEVPVEAGDLHVEAVLLLDASGKGEHKDREQPDHADGDVGAVEAGEHKEGGAEDVAVQAQVVVLHEGGEL